MTVILLIGITIGLVLGLTGAGGSIIAVPLLILLLNLSPSDAAGIALGAVTVSALYGSLLQRSLILWWPALILAGGGFLTAPLGKWLAQTMNSTVLTLAFSILAATVAYRLWFGAQHSPVQTQFLRAQHHPNSDQTAMLCRFSPSGQFQLRFPCIIGLVLGGLTLGLLSGLFGVGGGFLIVPLLLAISPLSMPTAIATSLLTITVVSASGFVSHLVLSETNDQWKPLALLLSGGIAGMFISQHLANRLAGPTLQKLFALTLFLLTTATLTKLYISMEF